jgi:hypothetical protein
MVWPVMASCQPWRKLSSALLRVTLSRKSRTICNRLGRYSGGVCSISCITASSTTLLEAMGLPAVMGLGRTIVSSVALAEE